MLSRSSMSRRGQESNLSSRDPTRTISYLYRGNSQVLRWKLKFSQACIKWPRNLSLEEVNRFSGSVFFIAFFKFSIKI